MQPDRQAQIRSRAYELWEQDDRPEGRALEYWFRAEAESGRNISLSSKADTKSVVAVVRDLFFITAILLFFTGWLFAYYLLGAFGVSAHMADIPIYAFYFYSLNTLFYLWSIKEYIVVLLGIAAYAVVLAHLAMPGLAMKTYRHLSRYIFVLLFCCVAVGFVMLFSATWHAAQATASAFYEGRFPMIRFHFKEDSFLEDFNCTDIDQRYVKDLCNGNLNGRLALIRETTDYYIVLHRVAPPADTSATPSYVVYRIPTSEVVLALTPQTRRRR